MRPCKKQCNFKVQEEGIEREKYCAIKGQMGEEIILSCSITLKIFPDVNISHFY